MDTKMVLEHTCFQKDHPLSPVKCRCRKYVSTTEAAQKVKDGVAQYIRVYKDVVVEETCRICGGLEKEKLSCLNCGKTGKESVTKTVEVYGDDIIVSVEDRGRRQANSIKKKTPRSPTIEEGHIERALNEPDTQRSQSARDRWDEYNRINVFALHELGAAVGIRITNASRPVVPIIHPGTTEPEDNKKTGTGRSYDYGRPV